jgi:phosphoribosylaminoimidazole-succinocarboxamide synthase
MQTSSEFPIFAVSDLPLPDRRAGKVRESYAWKPGQRLMVTTDRLSAFDQVLGCVPTKGQVLNRLSAWWFEQLRSVWPNHLVETPDANAQIVTECRPLPVEVVVRGYMTGVTKTSLWTRYAAGEREIYGYHFPDGMTKNQKLDTPLVTPTTKAEQGGHDVPITGAEIVSSGLVEAPAWVEVQQAALGLFARGQEIAAARGLVLVDTKYEFGWNAENQLILIDEVHTPDSARFWKDGVSLDKEVVRQHLAEIGYRGEGSPPMLVDSFWDSVAETYRSVFEILTGTAFAPVAGDPNVRLKSWLGQ